MAAFLSSFEWRIANFMIPVAFIDYIQGYTTGELCKKIEVNKNHPSPTSPFKIESPPSLSTVVTVHFYSVP